MLPSEIKASMCHRHQDTEEKIALLPKLEKIFSGAERTNRSTIRDYKQLQIKIFHKIVIHYYNFLVLWLVSGHLVDRHQASGQWGCVLVFAGGQDSRQGQGLTTHTIIVKDKCLNVASMFLIGWNFCHWSEHERVLFSWEWVTLPYYWLPLLAVGGLVLCKILINLW